MIILILFSLLAQIGVHCQWPVTARCGSPLLPPNAARWLVTRERNRFENNEKVYIVCKKNEFVHHQQSVVCKNGRWIGKSPRCGQRIEANVNHLNIYECDSSPNRLLLSQPINQTAEAPEEYGPLPYNAFHSLRVPFDQNITASGHSCYTFETRLNKSVQITFLIIDIWHKNGKDKQILEANAVVSKYRNCSLQKTSVIESGNDTIVGYYFFCDLNNGFEDLKKEESESLNTLSLNIKTNFTEDVSLEAVIIGGVYKNELGEPDCGQIESMNTGFDIRRESSVVFVSCNQSFIDITDQNNTSPALNGNPRHKFICNANGLWEGQWPVCAPIKSCAADEVQSVDSTVTVKEVANVYYVTPTEWYAIDDSYVRYDCVDDNHIMVGNSVRVCRNGQWTSKAPNCTEPDHDKTKSLFDVNFDMISDTDICPISNPEWGNLVCIRKCKNKGHRYGQCRPQHCVCGP